MSKINLKLAFSSTKNGKKPLPKKYILSGLLGRAVGTKLRKGGSTPVIDRLMSGLSKLDPLPEKQRLKIGKIYRVTKYWHGTGRYQIRDNKKVDILAYIAERGKLEPQYDDLDFVGPMMSLSTTRSRMYARVYADAHGKGAAEENRHGSSLFWGTFFMGDIAIEVAMETKAWHKSGRDKAIAHFNNSERAAGWGAKVSAGPTSTEQILMRGSTIKGNYPILFGIRDGAFSPVKTSRSVAILESRSQETLDLDRDITHIEVPLDRVEETLELLKTFGHIIPVLPIESCERYVAQLPFSQLVSGDVL